VPLSFPFVLSLVLRVLFDFRPGRCVLRSALRIFSVQHSRASDFHSHRCHRSVFVSVACLHFAAGIPCADFSYSFDFLIHQFGFISFAQISSSSRPPRSGTAGLVSLQSMLSSVVRPGHFSVLAPLVRECLASAFHSLRSVEARGLMLSYNPRSSFCWL
jgi:hypothetical protein